jgi:hypothetical protein
MWTVGHERTTFDRIAICESRLRGVTGLRCKCFLCVIAFCRSATTWATTTVIVFVANSDTLHVADPMVDDRKPETPTINNTDLPKSNGLSPGPIHSN